MRTTPDAVRVEYGDTATADLVVRTDYEALLDVAEGLMSLEDFGAHHVEVVEGADHADVFFGLMAAALTPER